MAIKRIDPTAEVLRQLLVLLLFQLFLSQIAVGTIPDYIPLEKVAQIDHII
jgi:hypothetical protein